MVLEPLLNPIIKLFISLVLIVSASIALRNVLNFDLGKSTISTSLPLDILMRKYQSQKFKN